jgi:hypothetical protein
MHPVMRQQLAAERVHHMIAKAEGWRLARQALLARRSRTSRQVTPPGPLRTQPDTERPDAERPAVSTAAASAGPAP